MNPAPDRRTGQLDLEKADVLNLEQQTLPPLTSPSQRGILSEEMCDGTGVSIAPPSPSLAFRKILTPSRAEHRLGRRFPY